MLTAQAAYITYVFGPKQTNVEFDLSETPMMVFHPAILTVLIVHLYFFGSLVAAVKAHARTGRIVLSWLTGTIAIPGIAILGVYCFTHSLKFMNVEVSRYVCLSVMGLGTIGILIFTTWLPRRGLVKDKGGPRGRTLETYANARKLAQKLLPQGETGLFWGGLKLPDDSLKLNFCAAGSSRSGKTVTVRLLLQSALAGPNLNAGRRGLIYDPKREFYPFLLGMGIPKERIKIANPLDNNSSAWRIAEDIQLPTDAAALTNLLIPQTNERDKYFTGAARKLTKTVVESFMQSSPGKWTLSDVLATVMDDTNLKRVLSWYPEGRRTARRFFKAKSYGDIRTTLDTCLEQYCTVASLWDHASGSFSVAEWARSDNILLLSLDDSLAASLLPIYRVLFDFAWQQLSTLPKTEKPHTWIVVDEAQDAGELPAVRPLLRKGAGHGVRFVLAFQDYSGMCETYGPHGADHLTGLCGLKALFRTDSPPTAQWAASHIGRAEIVDKSLSSSIGDQGTTRSVSEQIRDRFAVYPDELMKLQSPGPEGVHGYFVVPGIGSYRATVPLDSLMSPEGDEFDLRTDPTEQYLPQLDHEDWTRLSPADEQQPVSSSEPEAPVAAKLPEKRTSPLDQLTRVRLKAP